MKKRIEPTIGTDPETVQSPRQNTAETIQIPPLQRRPQNPRVVQPRPSAANPRSTTSNGTVPTLREQQIAIQRQQQTPQPRIRGMGRKASPNPVQTQVRPQVRPAAPQVRQQPRVVPQTNGRTAPARPQTQVRQQPRVTAPVSQPRVTSQPRPAQPAQPVGMHADARPMVRPNSHQVSRDPRAYPVSPGLFSLTGRIGCLKAIALTFFAVLFSTLVMAVAVKIASTNKSLFFMLSAIGLGASALAILIVFSKRLRDIDLSPWWVLALAVPGINLLFFVVVLLWPGMDDVNRFGYPAEDNNFLVLLVTMAVFLTTPVALGYTSMEVYEKVIFSGKKQVRYEQHLEE